MSRIPDGHDGNEPCPPTDWKFTTKAANERAANPC